MKNVEFILDPQLEKETHNILINDDFYILLHKNASIPWIIVVPLTNKREIYELSKEIQESLNRLYINIAQYFKKSFATEKMNIAAIGNIVSQLHIHVIGRKVGDACWPDVVWGNVYDFTEYTNKQIELLKNHFSKPDT